MVSICSSVTHLLQTCCPIKLNTFEDGSKWKKYHIHKLFWLDCDSMGLCFIKSSTNSLPSQMGLAFFCSFFKLTLSVRNYFFWIEFNWIVRLAYFTHRNTWKRYFPRSCDLFSVSFDELRYTWMEISIVQAYRLQNLCKFFIK